LCGAQPLSFTPQVETTTQNTALIESDIRSSTDAQSQFIQSFLVSLFVVCLSSFPLPRKMSRLPMFYLHCTSSPMFFIFLLHKSIFTKYIYSTIIYYILLGAPYIYNIIYCKILYPVNILSISLYCRYPQTLPISSVGRASRYALSTVPPVYIQCLYLRTLLYLTIVQSALLCLDS
jgi:hypothetical protein